jgi:hypothetical protein
MPTIKCTVCLQEHEEGLRHDKDRNLEPPRYVRLTDKEIPRFDRMLIASTEHLYDLPV